MYMLRMPGTGDGEEKKRKANYLDREGNKKGKNTLTGRGKLTQLQNSGRKGKTEVMCETYL